MKLLSKNNIKRYYDFGKDKDIPELMQLAKMAEAHRIDQWRKRIDKRLGRTRKKKTYLKPTDRLNSSQLSQLLNYIMGKAQKIRDKTDTLYEPVENEAIVLLMLGTGMRVREICNLRIENLPYYHKQDEIEIVDGKGRKDRTVGISVWLRNYLDEYCRKYHSKSPIRRHLFNSRLFKPITRRAVWGRIKTIGRDCGIWLYRDKKGRIKSKLSPHKFRHTYATLLLDVADNEFLVQDQLGHKSLETTHIYAKTLEMKRKTALNELQKRIFEGVNEDFRSNF